MNPLDLLGITREVGLRFTLVGLLPTALFAALVLAIVWSGAPADAPDLGEVADKAAGLGGMEGALLVVGLLAAGVLVQPLQVALVRVLEGYWGEKGIAKGLRGRLLRRQKDRLRALEERASAPVTGPDDPALSDVVAAAAERRRLFPEDEDDLLPTRLGNVLRTAELRAGSRYGLEAIVAWPRLYPLLPDSVRSVVDDRRDQLDVSARFCAVFLAAAVTSFVLLVPHPLWLGVPAVCLLLAALAYRAAVTSALAYGESICAAFDLHRFDLLRALHLPLPPDRSTEREWNGQLSSFLIQEWDVDFEYDHAGDETASRTGADRS